MAIHQFTEKRLEGLRGSVQENIDRYRAGDFLNYFEGEEHWRRILSIQCDQLDRLRTLQTREGGDDHDAENASIVYSVLENLTPMQARDERTWCYLCHFECLDYVRDRWRISDESSTEKQILDHFFVKGARALERDNAISRLWWVGYIASRAEGFSTEEALRLIFDNARLREDMISRPTTATNPSVFSAILRRLKDSDENDPERKLFNSNKGFRPFMKEVNRLGGVQLLESLGPNQLDELMCGAVERSQPTY